MSYTPPATRSSNGVMLRSTSQQLNGSQAAAPQRHTVQFAPRYPEHLNPFYKDDHHKRLRFLKVIPKKLHLTSSSSSSSSSSKPKSERRSSFSVDGIKEIWKLRPFRSANKKPMPTHVTKTSESPPQLRAAAARQQDRETFQDVPFQRSNRIRASMSEVSSSGNGFSYRPRGGDVGEDNFARNTRYRSTMGGSTTSPVYSMKPGTSQLSVQSTNPFEEDMMDDDMISVSGYSVASMPNRPYRKKRRAPLPPTASTNKTDDDKASTNPRVILTAPSTDSGTTTQVEIITEKATIEIQNISSEIDAMIRRTESRESIEKDKELPAEKVDKGDTGKERESTTQPKEGEKQKEDKPAEKLNKDSDSKETNEESKSQENETDKCPHPVILIRAEESREEVYHPPPQDVLPDELKTVSKIEIQEVVQVKRDSSPEISPPVQESFDSLRIIESEDEEEVANVSNTDQIPRPGHQTLIIEEVKTKTIALPKTNGVQSDPYRNVVVEMEKYDVRFVPLKGDEVEEEDPVRRNSKTVKDIIESINKSQSLLKINVDDQKRRASNGSINTRIRELERKESECKEMLNEIDLDRKIAGLTASPSGRDQEDDVEEIPVVIRELEKVDEAEINSLFKKCRPASGGNHDWNPLPKPKRSHSSSPSTPN